MEKSILHLDDDEFLLSEISKIFTHYNIKIFSFTDPKPAQEFIDSEGSNISLAIVDLFLAGDRGDYLSNDFIKNVLLPKEIKYFRLTSAPKLVPIEFRGLEVFDKRFVLNNSDEIVARVLSIFSEID